MEDKHYKMWATESSQLSGRDLSAAAFNKNQSMGGGNKFYTYK